MLITKQLMVVIDFQSMEKQNKTKLELAPKTVPTFFKPYFRKQYMFPVLEQLESE